MENHKSKFSQDGSRDLELLDFYPRMKQGFKIDETLMVDFEEEVDISTILEKVEFNEIDQIFKEIKSSIIN